ncbi:helix-turn-helix domain-containing protein [Anaerosacchariphilus polymeriproducens]|uniref:XRE family transcriptional regulator n=1 Tax=Anaerosacchariphilus polymeriproducens TaxID=1812858 RepID=A0A371AVR7_9FIRM|nr:helix-turn-helix transcriptional regulator [Anaerosacchariphilus polymeriproducens]RDU23663.1 XRE family transcriptional regulator [Anaerosacchariphilus polymeriproducens]
MQLLHMSENLVKLRHDRKITQDEIALFLGVTKASVSKWENNQSMPDIQLLPQIATYFGVTVDELLGYEPQLSKEQIQRLYQELAEDFANKSFIDTMKKCKLLVHKYYSCYPFLVQICVLWINHFMLAESSNLQQEILNDTSNLCERILRECKVLEVCNMARSLKAVIDLQLGNYQNVIESLEEIVTTKNLSASNDSVLIQAYQLAGETDKAKSSVQISMYIHLVELVGNAVWHLSVNNENLNICEETIRRTDCVISTYTLDKLHPNSVAQFYYQAAVVYAIHNQQVKALERLSQYVLVLKYLLMGDNINLHGDNYFNALDSWFSQLDLGSAPPRNKKLVAENALQSLDHPAFVILNSTDKFQRIRKNILKEDYHE